MLDNETDFNTDELLNEVLKTEPSCYTLPDNFAASVINKAEKSFLWKQYMKEFFIYILVVVSVIFVSTGIAFWGFDANWEKWINFVVKNIIWIVGVTLLLIFTLFTDKVLLRYFMYRTDSR